MNYKKKTIDRIQELYSSAYGNYSFCMLNLTVYIVTFYLSCTYTATESLQNNSSQYVVLKTSLMQWNKWCQVNYFGTVYSFFSVMDCLLNVMDGWEERRSLILGDPYQTCCHVFTSSSIICSESSPLSISCFDWCREQAYFLFVFAADVCVVNWCQFLV